MALGRRALTVALALTAGCLAARRARPVEGCPPPGSAVTSAGLARAAGTYAITLVVDSGVRGTPPGARATGTLRFRRIAADTAWHPPDTAGRPPRGRQLLAGELRLPLDAIGVLIVDERFQPHPSGAPLQVDVFERWVDDSASTGRPVVALMYAHTPRPPHVMVMDDHSIMLRVTEADPRRLRGRWTAQRSFGYGGRGHFCAAR